MARLLLVDDDIAEISAVKRALTRVALAPLLATNASDALASIRQHRPDLLLVGATCEGGEALALCRRLEEDEATRGIPLLVLGAAADLPAGASVLPRPVDPAALTERVKAVLEAPKAAPPLEPPVPPPPLAPPTPPAAAIPARAAAKRPAAILGRLATPALDLEPVDPPAPPPSPVPAAPPAAGDAEPVAPPPPPGPPSARPAFERRGPPIILPHALERRAQPSDPANARRAAADALRARAEELRRPAAPAAEPERPAAAEAAAGLDALFELAPPAGVSMDQLALTPAPATMPAVAAKPPPASPPAPQPPSRPPYPSRSQPRSQTRPQSQPEPAPEPQPEPRPEPEPPIAFPDAPRPFDASFFQSEDGAPIAETPFDLPPDPPEHTVDLEELPVPPPPSGAEATLPAPEPLPEPEPDPAWPPPPPPGRGRSLVEEAEERAAAEAALRAEAARRAEEAAERARQAEALAREETGARIEAARRAAEEADRAQAAEERARGEAAARAEAARQAADAAARARDAEQAARDEGEARRLLEVELERLRRQLEVDRRSHETELRSAAERTAAERAAEAARAEQEREAAVSALAAQAERAAETARAQALAAAREAEARAAAEAEAARGRAEAEAAKRAEVEATLEKLVEETARLAAERDALAKQAAAPPPPPARLADVPPPDEAQEAARRRALSLRARREPEPEPAPELAAPEPPAPPEPPPPTPPAELRAGSLEELPLPRLLTLAARARVTGRFDVFGDVERSLWLEEGRVVGAASSASGERVEEVALRLGLLTREQHRQVAGPAAPLSARRAALLLVDRGYVKPAELTSLVRRRTDEVVFGAFAESGARYTWAPERVPAEERTTPDRPPLALAVEGVRRRWLAPRAEAVLGGPAALLTPLAGAPSAAELGLSAEERRALALADGLRTLDEVLAESPLDALSTRQLLAAAVLTGALSVRVVQAGRPAAQVSAAIDLARVKEKLEQVRRSDYFTILGLGRVCTPHEVREAAERLLAEFDPGRLAAVREEGLPARLAEIRQVVADARDVLCDEALRAEYVRSLGE